MRSACQLACRELAVFGMYKKKAIILEKQLRKIGSLDFEQQIERLKNLQTYTKSHDQKAPILTGVGKESS